MSRSAVALILLAIQAILLAGARTLSEQEVVVEIRAESDVASRGWYAPPRVTIKTGTVVRWVNKDLRPHSVTSVNGLFDSGLIKPGSVWVHKFESEGEYLYECYACFCNPMTGKVVVMD